MRVCPYCVATKGLKAGELKKGSKIDMSDEEKFAKHLESEHHLPVRRKDETHIQCMKRFIKEYPDASNPKTCKCPTCKAKRGDPRELVIGLSMNNMNNMNNMRSEEYGAKGL